MIMMQAEKPIPSVSEKVDTPISRDTFRVRFKRYVSGAPQIFANGVFRQEKDGKIGSS